MKEVSTEDELLVEAGLSDCVFIEIERNSALSRPYFDYDGVRHCEIFRRTNQYGYESYFCLTYDYVREGNRYIPILVELVKPFTKTFYSTIGEIR